MSVEEVLKKYPLFDIAILGHGYTDYMRDYDILVEANWNNNKGRFLYRFSHCVDVNLKTRLADENWRTSWDNLFIDYEKWQMAGEPDGFLWGVKWSMAYPGLEFDDEALDVKDWSSRLEKEMHAVIIETNVFLLRLVFHGVKVKKLEDGSNLIDSVFIPLKNS